MTDTAEPKRTPNFAQSGQVHNQRHGENFSMVTIGPPEELDRYSIKHPRTRSEISGKVFLKEILKLSGMEISWGLLPPRTSFPFFHKHKQNEELYLFINGEGDFRVDESIMPITPGTAVRIATEGVRSFRNTSQESMFYIVIQAKEGSLEQWTGTDGIGIPGDVVWPEAD